MLVNLRIGNNSDTLIKVEVPILSHEECIYDTEIPKKHNVTENMLCAGYLKGGKDACTNDSGGPLVLQDDGNDLLVGIVSWGIGCAFKNYPGKVCGAMLIFVD